MVQLQHRRRKAQKMARQDNLKKDFLSPAEVDWLNNPGSVMAPRGRSGADERASDDISDADCADDVVEAYISFLKSLKEELSISVVTTFLLRSFRVAII